MPRINLLPWREQQRNERKMAFTVGLAAAAAAALVVAGAGYLFIRSMIDSQMQRNQLLRSEIQVLDKKIEEINSLETQKQQFIARMQIIEKLQRSRPEIVHVFDTLVTTLPDGTYLTGITQTGPRFKIQGVAQSSTRVSSFMRNIDSSQWLKNPELEVVESKKDNPLGSDFTLYADQVSTLADDGKQATPQVAKARATK
ncbi:MAG: PilN domain-containing protein [Steroidobacteraceae bacterium]